MSGYALKNLSSTNLNFLKSVAESQDSMFHVPFVEDGDTAPPPGEHAASSAVASPPAPAASTLRRLSIRDAIGLDVFVIEFFLSSDVSAGRGIELRRTRLIP